ncbi:MAG: N-acetylmuramidase family protein [Nitratireductor sp.]|nr:N-acetylmuramidase family protein [Nitratireductor sp.]
MSNWNGFKGKAKRLDDIDLPRIGATIGVGEDELHAFMDVEAAGSGFDIKGRPKMLFEPHRFYNNLSGKKRDQAVKAGLAYPRWGTKPYPKDSYPRLERAMEIDEAAALKSASWGLTQILGENHREVGYATVQEMVRTFMADEEAHVEAMVMFLIANHIDDDLRAHRWDVVARVYNGPGYATHNYHGRMADAYRKWAKIPDTPWSPDSETEIPSEPPVEPVAPTKPARTGLAGIIEALIGLIVEMFKGAKS